MQVIQTILSAVLAGCAVAPAAQMDLAPLAQDPLQFPSPKSSLRIAAATAEGGPSLADLLRDFGQVSGLSLSASPEVSLALQHYPVGMLQAVEVPPAEVYSFVESLLVDRGIVLAVLHAGEPRMLGIYQPGRQPPTTIPSVSVPSDQSDLCAAHPAIAVRTLLHLEWTDVRALANSMRAVSAMGSNIVPIGNSNSVLVEGPGRWVADMAKVMKQANELEREAMERLKKQQEEQERERRRLQEEQDKERRQQQSGK
jgi:hypothetical protein